VRRQLAHEAEDVRFDHRLSKACRRRVSVEGLREGRVGGGGRQEGRLEGPAWCASARACHGGGAAAGVGVAAPSGRLSARPATAAHGHARMHLHAPAHTCARACTLVPRRSDVQSLCDGVLPGSARVAQCLREQRAQLSEQCAQSLLQHELKLAGGCAHACACMPWL
jgi:hypothetical protein